MNLPNKLTILRVILIVPFIVVLLAEQYGWNWFGDSELVGNIIALSIFVVASFTDMLDGKIARKYNLVTNFGKFMDPIADKLLVCSAMIMLIALGRIPAWAVIIIIAREFIINGYRLVAADNGVVIAASYWGKSKTVFQMIMVGMMLLNLPVLKIATDVVMYISIVLTIVSLIDYLVKNKSVLKDKK